MDPDYEPLNSEDVSENSCQNAKKEAIVKRIKSIVEANLKTEIELTENDLFEIDRRLNESRLLLDRLRAAMLINFYDKGVSKSSNSAQSGIHPAIKTEIGKCEPPNRCDRIFDAAATSNAVEVVGQRQETDHTGTELQSINSEDKTSPASSQARPLPRPVSNDVLSKKNCLQNKNTFRIIVGNVSKYLPVDQRQKNDLSTHKWMVYVRGPRESPDISSFVNKVWFFLHPTYRPNDLVEVCTPPFHITRRGWGEFPVRVQLHLKDVKRKKIDIIHLLKLDRTYTGLQTLGSETHVDVQFESVDDMQFKDVAMETDTKQTMSDNSHLTCRHSPTISSSHLMDVSAADCVKEEPDILPPPSKILVTSNGPDDKIPVKVDINNFLATQYEDNSKQLTINESKQKKQTAAQQTADNILHRMSRSEITSMAPDQNRTSVPTKQVHTISLLRTSLIKKPTQQPQMVNLLQSKKGDNLHNKPSDMVLPNKTKPVYMKLALTDGRIMLVKKEVADNLVKSTGGDKSKEVMTRQSPIVITASKKPSVSGMSNATPVAGNKGNGKFGNIDGLASNVTRKIPALKFITDMEHLVENLARCHPLLCGPSETSTPTKPSVEVFMSWPLAKRRALEWQRAKFLRRQIVEMSKHKDFNFSDHSLWTTKALLLWCRCNLFTLPCKDHSPKLYENTILKPADKFLSANDFTKELVHGLQPEPNAENIDIESINTKAASQSGTSTSSKDKKLAADVVTIMSPTKEEVFIAQLVSQIGLKTDAVPITESLRGPLTNTVLYKAYLMFMENLIRKSFAIKVSSESDSPEDEITVEHVFGAIRCNEFCRFLTDMFADIEDIT